MLITRGFLLFLSVVILMRTLSGQTAPDANRQPQPNQRQKPAVKLGPAAPYLYNSRLDQKAQEANKAAGDVTSGQVFDTELSNLSALEKPSLDRIFSSNQRAAMAEITATRTWFQLKTWEDRFRKFLTTKSQQSTVEVQTELTNAIEAAQHQAQEAAKTQAQSTSMPDLANAVDLLGNISDAGEYLDYAAQFKILTGSDVQIAKQLTAGAGKIQAILKELAGLKPAGFAADAVSRAHIDLLKAELEHVTAQGRIEARRAAALDDVKILFEAIDEGLKALQDGGENLTDSIESTLRRLAARAATARRAADAAPDVFNANGRQLEKQAVDEKKKLSVATYLLENYSALVARAALPGRVAELRSAMEERRYNIRRDSILARSYEEILSSGMQRIANYYKGGIRPTVLAQFAQALAAAGLIPTIALK